MLTEEASKLTLRQKLEVLTPHQVQGVCAVINKTCCTYVNNSRMVETNIRKIYKQAEWLYNQQGQGIRDTLTSPFPSLMWLLPPLGLLITLLLLLLLGRSLFNLLVNLYLLDLSSSTSNWWCSKVFNQSLRVMLKPTNIQYLWWLQGFLLNL